MIEKLKKIILFVGILYFSLFMILLLGVLFPKSLFWGHARRSYEVMLEQGMYYDDMDTWTDAYFLNAAVTEYDGNLIERVFANAITQKKGGVLEDYSVDGLGCVFQNPNDGEIFAYSRYYVGSMLFLKMILVLFDIRIIRILLKMVVLFLVIRAFLLIKEKCGLGVAIAFVASVILYNYIKNAQSLAFCFDYLIMLLAVIVLLKKDMLGSHLNRLGMFYLIGTITVFAGYWSTPVLTLCFPLIVYFSRNDADGNIRTEVIKFFEMCFAWAGGAAITMLIKHLINIALFEDESSSEHISKWIGNMGIIERVKECICRFIDEINTVELGTESLVLVLVGVLLILCAKGSVSTEKRIINLIIVGSVALIPLVWEAVFIVHGNHGFVRQMYGATYFSLFTLLMSALDCKRIKITDN